MYVLPATNNKYVPIQKITTTIDLDQSKWKKVYQRHRKCTKTQTIY